MPEKEERKTIFEEEDLRKIKKAEKKLYTAPVITMSIFSFSFLLFKYGNLSRILPNPLRQPK